MKKLPLKKTWQQFVPGESRGCDLEEGLHDGHDRCLTQRTNERASSPSVGRSRFQHLSLVLSPGGGLEGARLHHPVAPGPLVQVEAATERRGLPVVKTAFSSDQSCGCCHWESGPEGPTRPTRPELASSRVVHCTPPLGTDRHHLLSATIYAVLSLRNSNSLQKKSAKFGINVNNIE